MLGLEVHRKYFYMTTDISLLMPSELGVPVMLDFKQAEFIYAKREKTGLTHGDSAELHLDIKRHYL